jgi:hypothetical protein
MRDDFQQMLNDGFAEATTNYKTVLEETVMGSNEYEEVEVRITHVINTQTGTNMGDDWKTILFKDIDHATAPGYMYYFDDNYWLVNNTEIVKNLAAAVVVRRCNNVLRWIDDNGSYHSCPCIIDYELDENKDYQTVKSSLVAPSAFSTIFVQFNEDTNIIFPNQRFLFGNAGFTGSTVHNWAVYKILGGGVNNLNNQQTEDNLSNGFIRLSLMKDYVNDETDDIVNGVADVLKRVYTVTIDQSAITGNIGREVQLNAITTLNGVSVTKVVEWSSDDEEVAIVTQTGLLVLNSLGSCNITCTILNNPNVTDSIPVSVTQFPSVDYHIVVLPEQNYILETDNLTYTVYLYKNNVVQTDTFTFSVTSTGVPLGSYLITPLTGNSFNVTNLKMSLSEDLVIRATSGIYYVDITIKLRGMW